MSQVRFICIYCKFLDQIIFCQSHNGDIYIVAAAKGIANQIQASINPLDNTSVKKKKVMNKRKNVLCIYFLLLCYNLSACLPI